MKEMSKQNKFDYTILICHAVNVLLVFLISLGLFDGIEFFSIVLFASMTLVMIVLIGLKWYNIKQCEEKNIENNKMFEYVPYLAIVLMELIYGIKMTTGINKDGQFMSICVMFAFALLTVTAYFIYKEKCDSIGRKLVCYTFTYLSFMAFILAFMVIVLDWGFI